MYFDDFKAGDVFELDPVTIKKDRMLAFAEEYDPQNIHMDEEYGKASRYGDIIAPGIMSFMSVWSEFVKSDIIFDHFISAQSFKVNWLAPVFADEVLTGRVIIRNVIPRNPYNGIVEVNLVIYNQDGKMVMDTLTEAILERRR